MLTVQVTHQGWNEETEEFVILTDDSIPIMNFEHSLVSLSKWESVYQVPFLSSEEKTGEQVLDYVHMMCLTPGITMEMIRALPADVYDQINAYVESPQSATKFAELPNRKGPGERITSELIYAWMTIFNIPWEAQTWHLNRLFALIRICNSKQNGSQKKMSRQELAERNRILNEQRKAQYQTSG